MELRLATPHDLPQLKAVYGEIVRHMNRNGIRIWDEFYPCQVFAQDIAGQRLYLLTGDGEILAAFALGGSHPGAGAIQWEDREGPALYLDRLGVNVNHLRKGIGSALLTRAKALAREKGARYLRLFVVDVNRPAISLYLKNGFVRMPGAYDEVIDEGLSLHEFGFEVEISP